MAGQQPETAKEIDAAVREKLEKIFCKGTLAEKTRLALALSEMRGLNSFMTALPWRITFSQKKPILGFSENLFNAAKDIHAQLVFLAKTRPGDAIITIAIDEARLPQQPKPAPSLKTIEGG